MRLLIAVATFLATCGVALSGGHPVTRLAQCQAAYQEFHKRPETGIQEQLDWWQSQEPHCIGTGLYEYFLGKLHLRAGEYERAAAAFQTGLDVDSEYEKVLHLALGDLELAQGRWDEAEKIYRATVEMYPDWQHGHHSLGLALWGQEKWQAAIESLNRSIDIGPTTASLRILTMAYYSAGEYQNSADTLNLAYSLDPSIAADRDPMVAGIRSFTELGKFEVAKGLLAMLLREKPEIRSDEEFLKAGFYLREKMVAAGALD